MLRRVKSCLLLQNVRFLYLLPFFIRTVRRCPICNGEGTYEARNAYTALHRCSDCGHVYSYKQPKQRILRQMYKDADFWEGDKTHQGIKEIAYGPEWKGFLDARTGIALRTGVLSDDRPHRVFEIGCSEGMLLKELTVRGHDAAGSEINPVTSRMGMEALGVKILVGTFEQCPVDAGVYDAVLSFHTLEHLQEPRRIFEKIASMLKPEGALLVEVPTGPEEYHNTYHLHFFGPDSLERLLGEFFEDVEILRNEFVDPWGTPIVSLYGVGKRPRLT